MEAARADAEKIRLIGSSEASAIEAVGKAEAERMRLKASAYKQYGDAAMLSLVLETLPKVGSHLVVDVSDSYSKQVPDSPTILNVLFGFVQDFINMKESQLLIG